MMDRIEQYVQDSLQEHEALICALARIPAPSGQEDARAAYVLHYLQELGYDQAFIDDAKNVICEIKGRDPEGPVHIFAAHLDTVFPDTEPLPVTVTEDRISAPGVGDDTANVSALLMILRYLSLYKITPAKTTVFAMDSCEEGLGNLKGCRSLMERYADRCIQFVSLDMGFDEGTDLAVGSRRYRISLETEGGHSYWNFGNKNAIAEAADLISKLYAVKTEDFPGKVTYNAGVIEGGTSVNTIAQRVSFLFEYRADSAAGLTQMEAVFKQILEESSRSAAIRAERIGDRPGMGPADPATMDALRQRVTASVQKRCGRQIIFASGSTDCNIPLSMGIPSICFGSWLGAGAHTREEYIWRSSLQPGLAAALDFVLTDMQG